MLDAGLGVARARPETRSTLVLNARLPTRRASRTTRAGFGPVQALFFISAAERSRCDGRRRLVISRYDFTLANIRSTIPPCPSDQVVPVRALAGDDGMSGGSGHAQRERAVAECDPESDALRPRNDAAEAVAGDPCSDRVADAERDRPEARECSARAEHCQERPMDVRKRASSASASAPRALESMARLSPPAMPPVPLLTFRARLAPAPSQARGRALSWRSRARCRRSLQR